ncbi:MAG: pyridoxamine 5'-phosphate oxidase family protein [bacterium]
MNEYKESLNILSKLFSKDCQFSLATTAGNVPSVRIVDTFYEDACFYVVTYSSSKKIKEIEHNKNVALCNKLNSFSGLAYNIGHPKKAENTHIREKLTYVFRNWYFKHNDENDPLMCYMRIELLRGFFYCEGLGYKLDFQEKHAKIFPFNFNPVILP